jgi:ubiquinone/menaquinone biosynthesis C-methylase UbiE
MGYWLASPVRGWLLNPEKLLCAYITPGMTVLEPGPGMGFFTLPLARLVGDGGRVVAVDLQPRMLEGLRKRVTKEGLGGRIEVRLAEPHSLKINDLKGCVDFVLAVAVVHEMPAPVTFFAEAAAALKPGGRLLLVEPVNHVSQTRWNEELKAARSAGLVEQSWPAVRRNLAVLLQKR